MRLGLMYVSGLRRDSGEAIPGERGKRPFDSVEDLRRRAKLNRTEMRTLAEIGALGSFGMRRRQALWQVGEELAMLAGWLVVSSVVAIKLFRFS